MPALNFFGTRVEQPLAVNQTIELVIEELIVLPTDLDRLRML